MKETSMPKPKAPQTLDRDWLSIDQTAEYFQVAKGTIRNWIKAGVLEASQLVPRGAVRISAASVEKQLERSRKRH